jgi:hypothetical protein
MLLIAYVVFTGTAMMLASTPTAASGKGFERTQCQSVSSHWCKSDFSKVGTLSHVGK